MNCEKLKKLVSDGYILIDVRSPIEYRNGHVKGSVNIEPHDILSKYDYNDKILLYCRSGLRSGAIKDFLQTNGYAVADLGSINQFVGCIE